MRPVEDGITLDLRVLRVMAAPDRAGGGGVGVFEHARGTVTPPPPTAAGPRVLPFTLLVPPGLSAEVSPSSGRRSPPSRTHDFTVHPALMTPGTPPGRTEQSDDENSDVDIDGIGKFNAFHNSN